MADAARLDALRRSVQLAYVLQGFAVLSGALGSGTITAQFLFAIPALVALVIGLALREPAKGSWLASHVRWQLRSASLAVAWAVALFLVSAPLTLLVIGVFLPGPGLALIGLWVSYRVLRGLFELHARQPMPVPMPELVA